MIEILIKRNQIDKNALVLVSIFLSLTPSLRLPHRQIVDAALYPKTQSGIIGSGVHALIGQRFVQGGAQSQLMQHFVRQRYLGGPFMSRRIQMAAGRPMR